MCVCVCVSLTLVRHQLTRGPPVQVDVVHIFEKQRKTLSGLTVHVDGQRTKEGPRPLQTIHMTFKGKGSFTQQQLEFAVKLAAEKYCGVYATLQPTVALSWQAIVE